MLAHQAYPQPYPDQWLRHYFVTDRLPAANSNDPWIANQVVQHNLKDLEDTAIAIDATYYLQQQIDAPPHEPLLLALGGLTSIRARLDADIDQWLAHGITPFFIFDGQPIPGEDEVTTLRGLQANEKTDYAWDLYFNGIATDAVQAFGQVKASYRPQSLYPLLQSILRARKLHFLVAPFKAASQIAYFDMIDSDQCGGVMGSLELLLYPINDCIIRSIDWETNQVSAISKKNVLKALNVTDFLFVDAFLMTGTSFLTPFPALADANFTKIQPHSISDAINMLRAAEKKVKVACSTFGDLLQKQDPHWYDKYCKARMAVDHFIYIAESGEVKIHGFDGLTHDNFEYLGFRLPSELYHYLNTGLIGPRLLSWITQGQLHVLPTVDGAATEEYKNLVQNGSARIKEAALSLVIPRLNRGISHRDITMKVWYDRNYTYQVWDSHEAKTDFSSKVASWAIAERTIKAHFPKFNHGSIVSEIEALQKPDFAALTLAPPKPKDGTKEKPQPIGPAGLIQSICLWRFLHIRGYIDEQHELTRWGKALAIALSSIKPTVEKHPDAPNLFEPVLVAFELLRLELLHSRYKHEELRGLPMYQTPEEQSSLLLISRCATLLRLRQGDNGYTGPLNKNLLAYRSVVCEVRAADRDLIEAIAAHMFLCAQAQRNRDDNWELGHRLPFLSEPDAAFGIMVKTYFDDISLDDTPATKAEKKHRFVPEMMPNATSFEQDLDIAIAFFDSLYAGVRTLENEIPAGDQQAWKSAAEFLAAKK